MKKKSNKNDFLKKLVFATAFISFVILWTVIAGYEINHPSYYGKFSIDSKKHVLTVQRSIMERSWIWDDKGELKCSTLVTCRYGVFSYIRKANEEEIRQWKSAFPV